MEALHLPLPQVWQSPEDNQFFQLVATHIKSVGLEKAFSGHNDFMQLGDVAVG